MNSSESVIELAKAVTAAQAEFKTVEKGGFNKFDRYAYAKLEDYVHAAMPILGTHGISILSSVEEVIPLEDRDTKSGGKEHAVRVKIVIRLMHVSGEWIETPCFGEGQDRADKAVYKAITGARKYGLASALGLATADDPENEDAESTSARGQQSKAPARQPAQAPDPLSNDDNFRGELEAAFQHKHITPTAMDAAIAKVIKAKKVENLEGLPLKERRAFIAAVLAGSFDPQKAA